MHPKELLAQTDFLNLHTKFVIMTSIRKKISVSVATILFLTIVGNNHAYSQGFEGYYRYPDIHENIVIFTAEGDLWTVPLSGGLARRLTSHQEEESYPKFSRDGKTILY